MPDMSQEDIDALNARATAGDTAATELAESQTALSAAQAATATAIASQLESTRQAHPEIPSDLIVGDSAEAIAQSVEAGAAIVEQVRAANPPPKIIPPSTNAGTPPRDEDKPPDGVRGARRITYGLEQQQKEG